MTKNSVIYSFIFTNYNNEELTIKCIESIKSSLKESHVIVIVDNCSENIDNLDRYIKKEKNAILIKSKENVGYFPGLNIGIEYLKDNYDFNFCIIGNNDIIFNPDFFDKLSNSKALSEEAVISPRITTVDGVEQNPHLIDKISLFREIIYDIYYSSYIASIVISLVAKYTRTFTDRPDESFYKQSMYISQGYGACYILTKKFFKYFEKLDAPTFLMGEEYFLSRMLEEKGMKKFYCADIGILHLEHSTVKKMQKRKFWEISQKSHWIYRKYNPIFRRK